MPDPIDQIPSEEVPSEEEIEAMYADWVARSESDAEHKDHHYWGGK